MNTNDNTLQCFFCGRDLSKAQQINYVAEGPICSICLFHVKQKSSNEDDNLSQYDQILYE